MENIRHINVDASRSATLGAAALAILVGASTVCAPPSRANEVTKLAVELSGHVDGSCYIGIADAVHLGTLGAHFGQPAKTAEAVVDIDFACNSPFELMLTSAQGALLNTEHPNGVPAPIGHELQYSIGIEMPLIKPHAETLAKTYTSETLRSGVTLPTGDAIALDGARLTVRTGLGDAPMYLAGSYGDTVTLSVSPRL